MLPNISGLVNPLFLTQSKRLETYYDCDLFYKDSSHQVVDLTPEGELLAMRTNEILSELKSHEKKLFIVRV